MAETICDLNQVFVSFSPLPATQAIPHRISVISAVVGNQRQVIDSKHEFGNRYLSPHCAVIKIEWKACTAHNGQEKRTY